MNDAPEIPLIAGKYRLIRSLAAGGMGALWLAEHVELETVVVVKRLLELRDSEADVARFRREAKAAAALRSRHIVRVHDFGTDADGPYLVMELLRGQDLAALIEQRGPLPVDQAAPLFRQAAKAMRVAHAAGVVHRDIKPSNLFLAEEEGEVVLKVLDFGIAKRFAVREGSAAITASGMLLGSPGYMAPEQIRGQHVDTRADVWALGVVLYEMLTNAPPFYSEHMGDSLVRVCAGDYPALTSLRPDLGPAWDEFFERALAVDPDVRFQSVEIMVHALDHVLGGAPDLSRVLTSAPTLKATSGLVGSLAPSVPERESLPGSREPPLVDAAHGPRTLDASQVPISEPMRASGRSRLVLATAGIAVLGVLGIIGVSLRESTEEPGDELTGASPVSADGASDALPVLERAGTTEPKEAISPHPEATSTAFTDRPPVAAGPESEPKTAQPAAPTKTAASARPAHRQPPTGTSRPPTQSSSTRSSPTQSQPAQSSPPTTQTTPRSSQPKRDPFTGLVME